MIHPVFVDHLVFRVAELDRTERFYTAVLGHAPQKSLDSLMYTVGDTLLFFTLASDETPYDKEQIGLNHIAFGLRTIEELKELQVQLHGSGIAHSGIKLDHYGLKEFIWLDDPDGIRVEFYLRPR